MPVSLELWEEFGMTPFMKKQRSVFLLIGIVLIIPFLLASALDWLFPEQPAIGD